MDSQQDKKNHYQFPKTSYKKSKTTKIQTKIEQNDSYFRNFKRSSSQFVPQKFVPKIRPIKKEIRPTFFILNEEIIYEIKEKHETKSAKDIFSNDDISLYDCLDIDEEKISESFIDLDEMDSYNIKSKRKLLSPIFLLRKQLQKIKNKALKINKYKNSNLLDSEKKNISIDIFKKYFLDLKCENKNNNRYNNKNILKRKPLLIFDVLSQTPKLNN